MTPHTQDPAAPGVSPRPSLAAIFRPTSVAIIGMSAKPGSAGQVVLGNLLQGGYTGAIHLVGRSGGRASLVLLLGSASSLIV